MVHSGRVVTCGARDSLELEVGTLGQLHRTKESSQQEQRLTAPLDLTACCNDLYGDVRRLGPRRLCGHAVVRRSGAAAFHTEAPRGRERRKAPNPATVQDIEDGRRCSVPGIPGIRDRMSRLLSKHSYLPVLLARHPDVRSPNPAFSNAPRSMQMARWGRGS